MNKYRIAYFELLNLCDTFDYYTINRRQIEKEIYTLLGYEKNEYNMLLDIFWLLVKLIIYPLPAQIALAIILFLLAFIFSKIHVYALMSYQFLLYFVIYYFYAFLGYYYFLAYKSVSDPNAKNVFTWIFILVVVFFIVKQMKGEFLNFLRGTKKRNMAHSDTEIVKQIQEETYQTIPLLLFGAAWISPICFILFTIFPKLPLFLFGDIHVIINGILG